MGCSNPHPHCQVGNWHKLCLVDVDSDKLTFWVCDLIYWILSWLDILRFSLWLYLDFLFGSLVRFGQVIRHQSPYCSSYSFISASLFDLSIPRSGVLRYEGFYGGNCRKDSTEEGVFMSFWYLSVNALSGSHFFDQNNERVTKAF